MADPLASPQHGERKPWWREMTRYHWWVLIIASMSWLFDCMDQRFFNIVRQPAMQELLGSGAVKADVDFYGRIATGAVLLGWAVGGFFFGMLGDRIGRVKTMMITILIYAGFTGLSAAAFHWWDFVAYRFLMGLGVGGLFAAAVSLVAEVTPPAARPHALGLLQALSTVGNMGGSAIAFGLNPQNPGLFGMSNWRWLFLVGVLPALLVVIIQKTLREPESWQRAKTKASLDIQKQLGSWKDLFAGKLRRNTLVGLALAVSGVIGLWGVGFFSPELVRDALKDLPKAEQDEYVTLGFLIQDVGAFFGIYFFTMLAARFGRRPAFVVCSILGFAGTAFTFQFLRVQSDVFWMLPILGFVSLSVFGGYSIYFPELYPTRLRSSGVGFCYNVGRVVAAIALFGSAYLVTFLKDLGIEQPFRVGSILIASIYFLGLIVLLAPETKDRPLEED
jgi:MFS family permease